MRALRKVAIPAERLLLLITKSTASHVTFTLSALHLSLSAGSWQTSLKKDSFNSPIKLCLICAWAPGVVQSP